MRGIPSSVGIVKTLRLLPGPGYSFHASASSGHVVAFALLADGTFAFDASYDGYVAGRGETTLVVTGWPITFAVGPLGAGAFNLDTGASGGGSTNAVKTGRLLPGSYTFQAPASTSASFTFDVSAAGAVDYPARFDALLTGRGTSTLEVCGYPVRFDARALSTPAFSLEPAAGGGSTQAPVTIRLLPATYGFRSGGATLFQFTVGDGGAVGGAQLGVEIALDPAGGKCGNEPPAADAGGDRKILSADQGATTLAGTASDPDGDPLTFRWLEGADVLASGAVINGAAPLHLGALAPLSRGDHLLTLEVRDVENQLGASAMLLTIDDSPPTVAASGGGVVEVGEPVAVGGSVSDADGDELSWSWSEGAVTLRSDTIATTAGGAPVALPAVTLSTGAGPTADLRGLGAHTLTLAVADGAHAPVLRSVTVEVRDTSAPLLAPEASCTALWPPDHKLVPVTILVNARDASGGPVGLAAQISSNEPLNGRGDGNTSSDWSVVRVVQPSPGTASGSVDILLRRERSGTKTGRVYTITITATDGAGNRSTATVCVACVPHHPGK